MTASVGFAEITIAVLIEQIIADIKEQYLADTTPWIIGFSGGKDSTTLLQLVFYALLELQNENIKLHKEIHVLCNDTLSKIRRSCAGLTTRSIKSASKANPTISR